MICEGRVISISTAVPSGIASGKREVHSARTHILGHTLGLALFRTIRPLNSQRHSQIKPFRAAYALRVTCGFFLQLEYRIGLIIV